MCCCYVLRCCQGLHSTGKTQQGAVPVLDQVLCQLLSPDATIERVKNDLTQPGLHPALVSAADQQATALYAVKLSDQFLRPKRSLQQKGYLQSKPTVQIIPVSSATLALQVQSRSQLVTLNRRLAGLRTTLFAAPLALRHNHHTYDSSSAARVNPASESAVLTFVETVACFSPLQCRLLAYISHPLHCSNGKPRANVSTGLIMLCRSLCCLLHACSILALRSAIDQPRVSLAFRGHIRPFFWPHAAAVTSFGTSTQLRGHPTHSCRVAVRRRMQARSIPEGCP